MIEKSAPSTRLARTKNKRLFISSDKQAIAPEELNQLFSRAGLPVRALDKLHVALQHSPFCVFARLFKEKSLVGFIRATSDGVFNTTVWDLVVDPSLSNQDAAKTLLITRLKREITKVIPNCAISILADPQDYGLLGRVNFAEDQKGIRAMVLRESYGERQVGSAK